MLKWAAKSSCSCLIEFLYYKDSVICVSTCKNLSDSYIIGYLILTNIYGAVLPQSFDLVSVQVAGE